MKNKKDSKLLIIIFIIAILVLLDQIIKIYISNTMYNSSKVLIKGVLNFTYVENIGGAFGIGNNVLILIIVNIILIFLLLKFIISKINKTSTHLLVPISLIIAGGIGNLIDRIFRGYVIDYIDINPLFRYPVFNFADICIVLGVIFIIIELVIYKEKL